MRFTYFEIKNFKGIDHIRIDFNSPPTTNIYTMIGLNESGKTTILEALNFFSYKTERLDPLNLPGYTITDLHELIPISKRSNFNDNIVIEAGYAFDHDEYVKFEKFLKEELKFTFTTPKKKFFIRQTYSFKSSMLVESKSSTVWDLIYKGKRKGSRKEEILTGVERTKADTFIRKIIPTILYFPNFLFEFPDRIYLEKAPQDMEKHAFYQTILQDILDAIGDGTNLTDHILSRAKSGSKFARQSMESVLLNMGRHISSTIFNNWNRIFKRNVGNKEIIVDIDRDEAGLWYLQFRLKDLNEMFSISERSLGFKWFFAFLLLTQYRGFRQEGNKDVLFLLDEPASNLHPSAQSQLLDSFDNFPENCSIVYTTHSHHMINPNWLEGAFVVKNEGLDYDSEDENYNAKKTFISLYKYRTFAANHPDQTTYFQPVLDVLNYSPSKLENVPNVVMVEGKNDFYTLKYFQQILHHKNIHLMPGGGAGSLDDVIRLYTAWGRNFIVLLDSDEAGITQKERYKNLFGGIVENRIFTLEDIESAWKKKGLEFLVEENDRSLIQNTLYPDAKQFNKTHFNRAIQELFLTKRKISLMQLTQERFEVILDFCEQKLKL